MGKCIPKEVVMIKVALFIFLAVNLIYIGRSVINFMKEDDDNG